MSNPINWQKLAKEPVPGSASQELKERVTGTFYMLMARGSGFGDSILRRTRITEVSLNARINEPTKKEATVVCELDVEEEMTNVLGNVHGGCSAFLIDSCSSLPFTLLTETGTMGVSQAINMLYHAPAKVGAHLKIISTTIAVGSRVMSARSEIWDTTNNRLIASGVHVKMEPSPSKL